MASRLDLHNELKAFYPNVYFQPPSNIKMVYPCIVYNKTGKFRTFAGNGIYQSLQEYQLTVIETNPDSTVADDIEQHFQSCVIIQYYAAENLNHTNLQLYY